MSSGGLFFLTSMIFPNVNVNGFGRVEAKMSRVQLLETRLAMWQFIVFHNVPRKVTSHIPKVNKELVCHFA